MLQRLAIQNYAIISNLDIHFGTGLNIITGETGAGKSILVGALGLVLGDRADTAVLSDPAKKAIVEASFRNPGDARIDSLLQHWDIEPDDMILVRREISAAGKSRAFINDSPVNLSQLQELSACLVDLHLQFDTQDLGQSDFQRAVLDALAGHDRLLSAYQDVYQQWIAVRKRITELEALQATALREQDYRQFLLDELLQLNWQADEMTRLEAEYNLLSHAEQIRQTVDKVGYGLTEGEEPVLRLLRASAQQLQSLAAHHPSLPELATRLQSAYVELQDIANELRHVSDKVSLDPQRLDQVNERIAAAQRLVKKHGLPDASELPQVQAALETQVSGFQQRDEEIQALRKQATVLEQQAQEHADILHQQRQLQVKPLEESVAALLTRVGMPNARLQVRLTEGPLREGGKDQVAFMFDANRSGHFEPLQKVASGGERSRLMLSIKSLVAGSLSMPTLIFDEIDSGISGEAARQVGVLMKELARKHQLISITHQPQIAARADHHFYVHKQDLEGRIQTRVRHLSGDEHIEAIARMMGGEKPSRLVLENAREMVEQEP